MNAESGSYGLRARVIIAVLLARPRPAPVRGGGAHRWALFGRIHAGGDGRRTARAYAGAVGDLPAISDRGFLRALRVLGAAGPAGDAGRPSASPSGEPFQPDAHRLEQLSGHGGAVALPRAARFAAI